MARQFVSARQSRDNHMSGGCVVPMEVGWVLLSGNLNWISSSCSQPEMHAYSRQHFRAMDVASEFKSRGGKGQNNMAVSKLEDRSADTHYFNTFWVSVSSSSKRVTSFFRRITSCSSWLRSLMWVWWDATRLCFRPTFSWVLWGGEQRVTGLSELLGKECKVSMNTVKEN